MKSHNRIIEKEEAAKGQNYQINSFPLQDKLEDYKAISKNLSSEVKEQINPYFLDENNFKKITPADHQSESTTSRKSAHNFVAEGKVAHIYPKSVKIEEADEHQDKIMKINKEIILTNNFVKTHPLDNIFQDKILQIEGKHQKNISIENLKFNPNNIDSKYNGPPTKSMEEKKGYQPDKNQFPDLSHAEAHRNTKDEISDPIPLTKLFTEDILREYHKIINDEFNFRAKEKEKFINRESEEYKNNFNTEIYKTLINELLNQIFQAGSWFKSNFDIFKFREIKSEDSPSERVGPFAKLRSDLLKGAPYYEILLNDEDKNMQIIKVTNKESKYILKRRNKDFSREKLSNIKTIELRNYFNEKQKELINFLETAINDFQITKMLQSSKVLPEVLDFNISYLTKKEIISIEILQFYGGITLSSYHPLTSYDPIFVCNLADRLLKILNYLESSGCIQNDLKPDNLVIDIESKEFFPIQLIDLDIYNYLPYWNFVNQSKSIRELNDLFDGFIDIKNLQGYTQFYAAPEIVTFCNLSKKEQKLKICHIDLWKCQIYSLGIILLDAIGFFQDVELKSPFDKYKMSCKQYRIFESFIDNYYIKSKDANIRKLIAFINFCIEYDPKDRPCAIDLAFYIKTLSGSSENQIILAYLSLAEAVKNNESKKSNFLIMNRIVSHLEVGNQILNPTNNPYISFGVSIAKLVYSIRGKYNIQDRSIKWLKAALGYLWSK